jgi:PhzF family phenazine biosynthesis protein
MIVPFSLIEVFNDKKLGFNGNIAAVVKLKAALPDSTMQQIAADFNQPATAFIWPGHDDLSFHIRWFAPDTEIGLCGHGSLAAVASLSEGAFLNKIVKLHYRNGIIETSRLSEESAEIKMKPIEAYQEEAIPAKLEEALNTKVLGYFLTNNKEIVLLENEEAIKNLNPNFALLRELKPFGYSITAPGENVDFVSRTIIPFVKQLEDPATGSSHAALTPFWAKRLSKVKMEAHQLSERGGKFLCKLDDEWVSLKGNYSFFAEGQVSIEA